MTNGEKLKELFNTYFPGVVLDDDLGSSCWIFKCPVKSMPEEEFTKLSGEGKCPCTGCSYDNWWEKEYKEPTVKYLTEEQAKAILYGDGRMDMQTIGTDQFIIKENEGGF